MYMYIWPSSDKVRVGIRIGAGGAQKLRFKDKAPDMSRLMHGEGSATAMCSNY